jgi:hypothetical protein
MSDPTSALTDYGFTWGPAEVVRIAEIPEGYVLGINTPYGGIDIRVSPTGRSVRVWDSKTGKEMTT